MMEKPEHLEQLTAYLDGELSPDERAAVERLLAEDAGVRRLLEELRWTSEIVGSLPRQTAPANIAEGVLARLERQALLGEEPMPRRVWRVRAIQGLALAASIALIVTAGWYVLPQLGEREKPLRVAHLEAPDSRDDVAKEGVSAETLVSAKSTSKPATATLGEPAAPPRAGSGLAEDRMQRPASSVELEKSGDPTLFFDTRKNPGAAPNIVAPVAPSPAVSPPENLAVQLAKKAEAAPAEERAGTPHDDTKPSPSPAGQDAAVVVLDADDTPLCRAGQFDQLLRARVICNRDLREAPAADFSNHIEIATPTGNRAELLAQVDAFMKADGVPNAQERDLPEPIAPTQLFYSIQQTADPIPTTTPFVAGQALESGGSDVEIVMNVTRGQAEELLASLQQISAQNGALLTWAANGLPVADENPVAEIARGLVPIQEIGAGGTGGGEGGPASAPAETAKAAPADRGGGTMRAHSERPGEGVRRRAIREGESAAARGGRRGPNKPAEDAGEEADRREQGGERMYRRLPSEHAMKNGTPTSNERITLALSLRVLSASEGPDARGRAAGSGPTTAPTAPSVPAPPPSTSQPTTQGNAGG